jgi:hypothetical protein
MTVVAINAFDAGTGNGAATSFPFTFRCQDATEVAPYLDGVRQYTGFTVTIDSDGEGGSVVFTTAPANGVKVVILSDPNFEMLTKFGDSGPFNGSTVDAANDAAAIRDVRLRYDIARAFRAPIGETLDDMPDKATRAGKFAIWDVDGNPSVASGTGSDANLRNDLALATGAALVGRAGGGSVQAALDLIFGVDLGTLPSGFTQSLTQQRTVVGNGDGTSTYYGRVSRTVVNGANAMVEARSDYNGLELNGTATVTTAIGDHRYVWLQNSGNVTNVRVFEGHLRADSTGDITSSANIFNIATPTLGASVTVAQLIGFNSPDIGGSGKVGTAIGFNQTDIAAGPNLAAAFRGQVANDDPRKYNLYMVGTANNFLAGQLGIGTTTPQAMLHVRKDLDGDTGPIIQNRNGSGSPIAALRFITGVFDLADNRYAAIKSGGSAAADLQFWVANGAAPFKAWRIGPVGDLSPQVAQSTTMTGGFMRITAAAGPPTGVPTGSGGVPVHYDTTNNKFYVYNGAWKSVTLA